MNIGDTVMLKSGGPRMTVVGTGEDLVSCEWFPLVSILESSTGFSNHIYSNRVRREEFLPKTLVTVQ